jgi:hypothetical protein
VPLLRRALILTHRWLGIIGSLFFIGWFASGIAMMYARMPYLKAEERLLRMAPLNLANATIGPAEAAHALDGRAQRVRIGMLDGRPVYRFLVGARWVTVFADTGERVPTLTESHALDIARAFVDAGRDDGGSRVRYDQIVREPDQWTLQIRALLPAHRIALGDAEDSYLYVSDQTAEPVLVTSRGSRTSGYLSAVVHWVYFTPIRRNAAAWTQLIIWSSVVGCVLCLSGLVWGVWQFIRLRGTAYTGLMRWHHYAGLIFGAMTFTFVFSGLLSMDPWGWPPTSPLSREQRDAVSGGPLRVDSATLPRVRAAVDVLAREFVVREIELLQFRGDVYAEAYRLPDDAAHNQERLGDPGSVVAARLPLEHRLVSLEAPGRGAFLRFDDDVMKNVARAAMPDVPVQDATWLTEYDAYYYARGAQLPLPVLRVRYRDATATWLYLDPFHGSIARKEERLSRLNRWLYHGLHSLDFPWLYQRRPLWDIVVIAISLGGLLVSVSSAPAGWRRIARVLRRQRM